MNTILTFCVVAFCTIQTIFCDDTMVKVEQGWLQGIKQEPVCKNYDMYCFKNIPYAKPPTGSLRFKAPEEPEPWEGTRDATAAGLMCPHYNSLTDVTYYGSEDCLTCDVYTPDTSKKLPVLFFLSGFAHFFDQDVVDAYEGDFLAEHMVFVRCNYRLDSLGFLALNTKDAPGNAAMKDQVAALKWVQNNIHAFGGDPNRVTLAGLSSGSASGYHHLMSPMSTGLFQQAMLLHGVPTCDAVVAEDVVKKSYELGARLGLETQDGDELLTYLQSLPFESFINNSYSMARENPINVPFKKMVEFSPTAEPDLGQERFMTEDYLTSITHAPVNKCPVVIGYSPDESLLFIKDYIDGKLLNLYNENRELLVPYKILKENPVDVNGISDSIKNFYFQDKDISVQNVKEFIRMTSFSNMIYEVIRSAEILSQYVDVYLYEFSSYSNRNMYGLEGQKYGQKGVAHADLLGYLFPLTAFNMTLDMESREHDLIVQFVYRFKDFIIHGNPSYSADFDWPTFTPEEPNYLEFTDQTTVKQDPYGDQMEFWGDIYKTNQAYY